jgi:hypothetical protein
MNLDRRHFLKIIGRGAAVLTGWPLLAGRAWAAASRAAGSAVRPNQSHLGRRFDGERMKYRCGFFIFPHAADTQISFRMLDDTRCRAVLSGRTRGIVGLFTLFRQDRYVADMRLVDGGRRLETIQLHEYVNIGRMRDRKIHVYDRRKRVVIEKTIDNVSGRILKTKSKPMPPKGLCDDYLTAFYNFRGGVYGPLAPGRSFRIQSNPHGHLKRVDIRVATRAEARQKRPPFDYGLEWHWLLEVKLDKDFLHSRTGVFQGWLDRNEIPVGGIIPDVKIFGDVWGYLADRRPPKSERG